MIIGKGKMLVDSNGINAWGINEDGVYLSSERKKKKKNKLDASGISTERLCLGSS